MIALITKCPFCGKENEIYVHEHDYAEWNEGKLTQDAFPYLSADEREMLITGTCPECWNNMFSNKNA